MIPITRELLRVLRNDLPMPVTFQRLGKQAPYFKTVEGRFRFQCPHCAETLAVVNPRNNLAHCFGCGRNINNIDLLRSLGYGFRDAVTLLQVWQRQHRTGAVQPAPDRSSNSGPIPIADLIQQEFGNRRPPQ